MTGPAEHAVVLQAASVLLQYPDGRVRAALPTVRAAVDRLPAGAPRRHLLDLVRHLTDTPAAELEREYVAVFDRRRKCCLYLTWWVDGETRRRGLSLARLKQLYRSRGMELLPGELPDHLPVLLEFAATADLELGLDLLQEYRAGLELLRLALVETSPPYAAAVQAVCALLPGPSAADEAAARAIAVHGPGTERVGLDGYGDLPPASAPLPFFPLDSVGVRR